mgnify:FL=1
MVFLLLASVPSLVVAADEMPDFVEVLMRSTFRIQGTGKCGTVFVMADPHGSADGGMSLVMLTAAHVLDSISGDSATVVLRAKSSDGYRPLPRRLGIRRQGRPLWARHPKLDLAALPIDIPREADFVPVSTNLLASDSSLENFEIGAGYEIFTLGFPFCSGANDAEFPILRSGHVAGFPLVPSSEYPTYFVDVAVFPGGSGGPVFIRARNPTYDGGVHLGTDLQFVLGILTKRWVAEKESVQLGEVVQAMYLKELLSQVAGARAGKR